jgi:hypothetical protein
MLAWAATAPTPRLHGHATPLADAHGILRIQNDKTMGLGNQVVVLIIPFPSSFKEKSNYGPKDVFQSRTKNLDV